MKYSNKQITILQFALLTALIILGVILYDRFLCASPYPIKGFLHHIFFMHLTGFCYLLPRLFARSLKGRHLSHLILIAILFCLSFANTYINPVTSSPPLIWTFEPIIGISVLCLASLFIPTNNTWGYRFLFFLSVASQVIATWGISYHFNLFFSFPTEGNPSLIILSIGNSIPFMAVVLALLSGEYIREHSANSHR